MRTIFVFTGGVLLGSCVLVAGGVPAGAAQCNGLTVKCVIGDTGPGGGKVFYDAGSVQSWGRYLEAAPNGWYETKTDPNIAWCLGDARYTTLTTQTGMGAGSVNTDMIIDTCGMETAAGRAASYTGGGKEDWYLPSKDELWRLYQKRKRINMAWGATYWSSSQNPENANSAFKVRFDYGQIGSSAKQVDNYFVRPVRAFGFIDSVEPNL